MKTIKGADTINCPNCDERMDVEFYSIINGEKDAEVKEMARGGELHLAGCPHCGAMFRHDVDFVYIDAAAGDFIFVFSKKTAENQVALKKKMTEDLAAIKDTFLNSMNIDGEPLYVFDLEELKVVLDKDVKLAEESEAVAAAGAAAGFKIVRLKPYYAKKNGYPLYVPGGEGGYLKAAQAVLEGGFCSLLLAKFAADLEKADFTPEVL